MRLNLFFLVGSSFVFSWGHLKTRSCFAWVSRLFKTLETPEVSKNFTNIYIADFSAVNSPAHPWMILKTILIFKLSRIQCVVGPNKFMHDCLNAVAKQYEPSLSYMFFVLVMAATFLFCYFFISVMSQDAQVLVDISLWFRLLQLILLVHYRFEERHHASP